MAKNIHQKVTPQCRDASIKQNDNHFTLGFFKKQFASTAATF